MLIDCDDCAMQFTSACNDCVVTYLLREEHGPVELDAREAEALAVMAGVGLLPRLRLVSRGDPPVEEAG